MIINKCEQGSQEWHEARLGITTSSNFSKIITPTGKLSTSSATYQDSLIADYIMGEPQDVFETEDMQNGIEMEPTARLFYESVKQVKVTEVGLVYLDERKTIACSPDGLIGMDKGVEIKCPKLKTQIKRVREGILPSEYVAQVQGSMWITGFKEWDFVSYHPDYEPFIITVQRDEEFISKLSESVLKFSSDLETLKLKAQDWKKK